MSKRILIIEDDNDTRFFLRKRLEVNNFECLTASSVEEGLKRLKEENPNLVILDLGFRQANGTAFLHNAHEWMEDQKEVPPIIVLSGFNDQHIVDYVMDQGAKGFIAKPYDPKELLSLVHDCLG